MDQNSGTFPLAPAMLDKHYREVLSFQEARARSARLLSKGALVAFAVSMLANLGWLGQ